MFRKMFSLSLVAVLAAFVAPAAMAKDAPDLSTPKAAVATFSKAIVDHDLDTIKASMLGNEEQQKIVEGMADLMASMRKFKAACAAKYGEKNELGSGIPSDADFLADAQKTEYQIEGDIAKPLARDGKKPEEMTSLRKVDGVWKVDFSTLAKEKLAEAAKLVKLNKVFAETADEIESGKHKTIEEAALAIGPRMAEAQK
jgi:hypothetical protein